MGSKKDKRKRSPSPSSSSSSSSSPPYTSSSPSSVPSNKYSSSDTLPSMSRSSEVSTVSAVIWPCSSSGMSPASITCLARGSSSARSRVPSLLVSYWLNSAVWCSTRCSSVMACSSDVLSISATVSSKGWFHSSSESFPDPSLSWSANDSVSSSSVESASSCFCTTTNSACESIPSLSVSASWNTCACSTRSLSTSSWIFASSCSICSGDNSAPESLLEDTETDDIASSARQSAR
mmetsp:Transcript_1200/g.2905  ORF Transcript_1200/g.2905 Transcript_1200/m.2905 type:complete len:235 (+) Transcript_1200:82-786(+)